MPLDSKDRRNLLTGLAFLSPNILGFLTFTLIPLVFSLVLAFSNWNLQLHNPFKPEAHIKMVGLANFHRLLSDPDFWKFLGNTLFFMMGLPLGIVASLGAAVLLSKDLKAGGGRMHLWLIAGAMLVASVSLLAAVGAGRTGLTILLIAVAGSILVLGTVGGTSIYRTLFYIPNFTSGVATFLLWKKLYNAQTGPINSALSGPLSALGTTVNRFRYPQLISGGGLWAASLLALLLLFLGLRRVRQLIADGDLSTRAAVFAIALLLLPLIVCVPHGWIPLAPVWLVNLGSGTGAWGSAFVWLGSAIVVWLILAAWARSGEIMPHRPWEGFGDALMYALALMVGQFILLGLGAALHILPDKAAAPEGLTPPEWLTDANWVKPAIMIMGFWGAIGSNTMLLYLAALTNVPAELYEAADIDGASRFTKFWNVTWPQLAPTTFFIIVMGVIGGLQGGFESAKVMTGGGPFGETTTLSYFIYNEGFTTGRLGYSSAVAWTMFLLVLGMTLFNWTFGNKYVND